MPQIASWSQIPASIRQHLVQRMRDRNVGLEDLNRWRERVNRGPKYPRETGTGILVHLSFAATANIPRRSFYQVR